MTALATKAVVVAARLDAMPWPEVEASLDAQGWAVLPALIDRTACEEVADLYDTGCFRSRIDMARHGFGQGEYQYFDHPLPGIVAELRRELYARLAPVANRWKALLGQPGRFPDDLAAYTEECRAAGQTRPTPLLLRYGPGDYNRLHQDVYGELLFPFQTVVLLSEPGRAFSGGEFVLVEQKPRSQSRVTVVPLGRGDAAIFAVNHRPARSATAHYRAALRHGVSTIREGRRHALGIVFHDAK